MWVKTIIVIGVLKEDEDMAHTDWWRLAPGRTNPDPGAELPDRGFRPFAVLVAEEKKNG